MKRPEFKKEFFDREYSAKEAYARLWRYASKYKARIALGVVCGMLTAGLLVPMYQIVKPAIATTEAARAPVQALDAEPASEPTSEAAVAAAPSAAGAGAKSEARAKGISKDYEKFRKWLSDNLGLKLQGQDEAIGLPLLFLLMVIGPLFALARLAVVFLAHYCLAWAGMQIGRAHV